MKFFKQKISLLVLAVLLTLGFFVGPIKAQTMPVDEEAIISFVADIIVNRDNSIDVTETIVYNSGQEERHGIYRDINFLSSQERKMVFDNVSVIDESGSPYPFQIFDFEDNTRIKIGDPDETFLGQKIYIIKYRATRAIAQFEDIDEIYWNVTGNEWNMPMYQVTASITLPPGTTMTHSACYYGPRWSTGQCRLTGVENETYTFDLSTKLDVYEGMTVAVGFPKGVVNDYTISDNVSNFFDRHWRWFVVAFLPIVTFIFSIKRWYFTGRDERGTGVIVPQYDVPDGLTPMEVSGIVNEKVTTDDISAQIIYLATQGYIKIRQLGKVSEGLFKSFDYELIKLKDFSDLPNDFDRKLLNDLFESAPTNTSNSDSSMRSVKLSDLKYIFYNEASSVVISVLNVLLDKGYYKNIANMKGGHKMAVVPVFFGSIWVSGFVGAFLGTFILAGEPFPMMVGIFVSIMVYYTIYQFNSAKTKKGVLAKEYILGLKNYLQIAEKDRLEFHNAPDKRPEVFEKLLPYAMVLGVANIWAKEFDGIYKTPPSWYSGSGEAVFSATVFGNSLNNFRSSSLSSLTSVSSGSSGKGGRGSFGGGSSGGGGGGGGGGSW